MLMWLIFVDAREYTTLNTAIFSNLRAQNFPCSALIRSIVKILQDLMAIYILTKFGADCLIFVDVRVDCNFSHNSSHSGLITQIIKDIHNPLVIYILTKFGADWLTVLDARV